MIKVMNLLFLRNSLFFWLVEMFKRYGKKWEIRYAYDHQKSKQEYANLSENDRNNYIKKVKEFANNCGCETPEEKDIIESLCSRGTEFNWQLRKNIAGDNIEKISSYIQKFHTKRDIVVYRGIDKSTMKWILKEADGFKNIDLYDKGFLFTTLTKATLPKKDYNLRILLPKGTNAFYSGDINNEEEVYQEIVVQCDAKLKIVSFGVKYINCLLVIENNIT